MKEKKVRASLDQNQKGESFFLDSFFLANLSWNREYLNEPRHTKYHLKKSC